eukprot:6480661-Amphidinium_carterae.1
MQAIADYDVYEWINQEMLWTAPPAELKLKGKVSLCGSTLHGKFLPIKSWFYRPSASSAAPATNMNAPPLNAGSFGPRLLLEMLQYGCTIKTNTMT